jgi:hypothetical protein
MTIENAVEVDAMMDGQRLLLEFDCPVHKLNIPNESMAKALDSRTIAYKLRTSIPPP